MHKALFIILLLAAGCVDFIGSDIVEVKEAELPTVDNNIQTENMIYKENYGSDMFVNDLVYSAKEDSESDISKMVFKSN